MNELMPVGYLAVFYSDDDVWHERSLLAQAGAERWVITTPDDDLYVENVMYTDPESGPCRAVVIPDSGEVPVFLKGRTYRATAFPHEAGLRRLLDQERQAGRASVGLDGRSTSTRWGSGSPRSCPARFHAASAARGLRPSPRRSSEACRWGRPPGPRTRARARPSP